MITQKPLTVWITRNWKILKERKYQGNLPVSWKTCTQVKKQQLELDMEKLTGSKGAHQDCILSTCLFNFYGEHWYIMWCAGMHESQAGIKTAGRNINNLRYTADTTLVAESKEKPKSLLMRVKRRVKRLAWNSIFQKTKIVASGSITAWQKEGEEKAMAPHSSTLAWKILWMEEPWKAAVHRVARSRTWLSDFTFTFHFHALEKEMATHSSVLAWRIPRTGEPGGLPSVGHTESDTTEVT